MARFVIPTLMDLALNKFICFIGCCFRFYKARKNLQKVTFITCLQCLHNIINGSYISTQRLVYCNCWFQGFTQSSFCLKHWVKFTTNMESLRRTYYRCPRSQYLIHGQVILFSILNFSCFVRPRNQGSIVYKWYPFIAQNIMVPRNIISSICIYLLIRNSYFLSTIQKYCSFYFFSAYSPRGTKGCIFNSSHCFGINISWVELAAKNKKGRFQKIFLFRTKFNRWVQKYKLFVSFLFRTFCVISKIHSFYTVILDKTSLLILKFLQTILKINNLLNVI